MEIESHEESYDDGTEKEECIKNQILFSSLMLFDHYRNKCDNIETLDKLYCPLK